MLQVQTDPLGARLHAAHQRAQQYAHVRCAHLHAAWQLTFGDPSTGYADDHLSVALSRAVHRCVHVRPLWRDEYERAQTPAACCGPLRQANVQGEDPSGPLACLMPDLMAVAALPELTVELDDLQVSLMHANMTPPYTRMRRMTGAVLALRTHVLLAALTGFVEPVDDSPFTRFVTALDACLDLTDQQLVVLARLGVDFTGGSAELLTCARAVTS